MNIAPTWTELRMDELKLAALDGLTASQIAASLGISRNAVIGKLARMGVPLGGGRTQPRPSPQHAAPIKHARRKPEPEPEPEPFINDLPPDASVFAVPIANLRHGMCRWPLGDPSAEMLYCGAASSGPWCPRHRRIAYKPMWRRGDA